ncbi:MAG: hypothetical protein JKX85_02595 [Phycisphaeraceae bacterium]|nr:hypothetical protein [Phycisphaeraceae bacterium]
MSVLAMQVPLAIPELCHPDFGVIETSHSEFRAQLFAMGHAVGGLTWTQNDNNGVYQITAGGAVINARPSQLLVRAASGRLSAMSATKFKRKYEEV